jgi:hypothetical protein
MICTAHIAQSTSEHSLSHIKRFTSPQNSFLLMYRRNNIRIDFLCSKIFKFCCAHTVHRVPLNINILSHTNRFTHLSSLISSDDYQLTHKGCLIILVAFYEDYSHSTIMFVFNKENSVYYLMLNL